MWKKVSFSESKKKFLLLFIIPLILLFTHLKQRPLNHEGGQTYLPELSQKLDWWGSILPIVSPYQSLNYGSFIISFVSLLVFIIGVGLITTNSTLLKKNFLAISVLFFCGYSFVIANSRDSFLLSFAVLSFGLINLIVRTRNFRFLIILFVTLILMVSFKYTSGLSITFILLYYLARHLVKVTLVKLCIIFTVSILVTIMSIALDKSLAGLANLKNSFPEQAPIYQDLAAFYCWSDDQMTRKRALDAITPILLTQDSSDICLTLRPNSWGYLVAGGNFSSSETPAPFRKITDKESNKLKPLIQGWLKTIVNDPVDYVQFKLISATQMISVGHPFKYPSDMSMFTNESDQVVKVVDGSPDTISGVSDFLWKVNRFLLSLIGSTYLFSIGFLLVFLLFISILSYKIQFNKEIFFFLLLSNIFNLIISSIAFVSDEARYVFPILFLSYLILLMNLNISKKL